MNRTTKISFFIILALLAVPVHSFAEHKFLKESLEKDGITENSRFYRVYMEAPRDTEEALEPLLWKETKDLPQGIIMHLRSTQGKDFKLSEPKQAKLPELEKPDPWRKVIVAADKKLLEQNTKVKPIPDCSTQMKSEKLQGDPREQDVILDLLFIRKRDLPIDPELHYGEEVQLIVYDESKISASNMSIQGARIPCLPFRIRSTTGDAARYYGKEALANFSKPVKGKQERKK